MLGFSLVRTGSGDPVGCSRCPSDVPSVFDTSSVLERLRSAVERSGTDGPSDVLFAGGEPLSRDDVRKLLQEARALGVLGIAAVTGGAPLGDPELARALVSEGLRHVHVMLLAHDADTHDALAGRPGFESARAGMRVFHAAGRDLGVRTMMCGRIPVCRHNLEYLPDTVRVFAENGADAVAITITGGLDVGRAAPWVDAAFDTGLVNAVWVSVDGISPSALRNSAASEWRPIRLVVEAP